MNEMIFQQSLMTKEEASKTLCPYSHDGNGMMRTCDTNQCQSWLTYHPEVEREDHSGAKEMIHKIGMETQRRPVRQGPPGSTGYWKLEATGFCQRLWRLKK